MTGIDPNIILVNVLATIGVVKAILWLLDTGEESSLGERRDHNKHNNKVKPLRMSKRILGILHDEDDEEEDKKDNTEKEEESKRYVPRWIRTIQEEAEELPAEEPPGARRARKATESVDEESIEIYLYAICICVSIILSIIILR